ncbi:MAG: hypothetical protein ACJ754_29270 [Pyrinomonadaceae bacterium]
METIHMPLSLPDLDDRRYADLVEEARALIPSYAPDWTNHNPSDPGITLVELFAYLTEMLLYRVNRVTDENMRAFVKLIAGERANPARELSEEIRDAVLDLRRVTRAVTVEDYERLAVEALRLKGGGRACCLPLRDLEGAAKPFATESKGHVSVVVLPAKAAPGSAEAQSLLGAVRTDLRPRTLLATRLHVVEPRHVSFRLKTIPGAKKNEIQKTTLVLKPGAPARTAKGQAQEGVLNLAAAALNRFFDPLRGGPDGRGWPFGRSIYVSEVYALLDGLPGVDYVSRLLLDISVAGRPGVPDAGAGRVKSVGEEMYAFELEPDELVRVEVSADDISAEYPVVAPKFDLKLGGS